MLARQSLFYNAFRVALFKKELLFDLLLQNSGEVVGVISNPKKDGDQQYSNKERKDGGSCGKLGPAQSSNTFLYYITCTHRSQTIYLLHKLHNLKMTHLSVIES